MTRLALTLALLFSSLFAGVFALDNTRVEDLKDEFDFTDDGRSLRKRGGNKKGGQGFGRSSLAVAGVDFTEITCPAIEDQPECVLGREANEGAWVCRTLYNIVTGVADTFSACVNVDKSIGSGDTCGCCNGECPAVCACTCEIPATRFGAAREGVLVQRANKDDAEGRCVDATLAARMVSGPGFGKRYECDETCSR